MRYSPSLVGRGRATVAARHPGFVEEPLWTKRSASFTAAGTIENANGGA